MAKKNKNYTLDVKAEIIDFNDKFVYIKLGNYCYKLKNVYDTVPKKANIVEVDGVKYIKGQEPKEIKLKEEIEVHKDSDIDK